VTEKAMTEVGVPYQVNDRQFEGMIVYDDTVQRKRPVVFMQPGWKGVCPDTVAQAHAVAGEDYVVLMADMFGAGYGDTSKTREQLAAGMRAVHEDLVFTLSCGSKAYEVLLAESTRLGLIDEAKKLAVGYCAGGGFVLEQARAGVDFNAVVVLHVTNPNPVVPGTPCNIKGSVSDPRLGRSDHAQGHDGHVRGRTQPRRTSIGLAGDDVRGSRPFILRPHRKRRPDATKSYVGSRTG
jgi:hypothetical protein